MHHFCPENITTSVSIFRPDGEVPVLNKQHWDGGQYRIFKVDFLNGESWSIRFPVHIQSDSLDTIINLLQGEQSVLQELNKRKFPWSPEHYGSILTFENCVGFPFMALSWIDGSPLPWTMTHPPRPVRDEVLRQIAEIQMALVNCTKEDRGPATQYFSRLSRSKLDRVNIGKLPGITVQDCLDQAGFLKQVLHPELEHAPFAIDHGDLSPSNIIVDSECNVTGIIDWGFASKAPVQLAARSPQFLQLSELVLPPSPTLQQDRKAYIASVEPSSSQAAFWMSLVCSTQDIDFRHCVLESMISKGMHQSLARLRWILPYRKLLNNSDSHAAQFHDGNVCA